MSSNGPVPGILGRKIARLSQIAETSSFLQQGDRQQKVEALRDALIERLWCQLPLARQQAEDLASVKEVVQSYNDSLELLRACHVDAVTMIHAVCESHVHAHDESAERSDELAEACGNEVERLQTLAHLPPISVSPALQAELFGTAASEAYCIILPDLRAATRGFIDAFLGGVESARGQRRGGTDYLARGLGMSYSCPRNAHLRTLGRHGRANRRA